MNKRNLAIVLWFLMGWTLGSILAFVFGLPTLVGGVPLAFASGAFIKMCSPRLWPVESASRTTSRIVNRAPLPTD